MKSKANTLDLFFSDVTVEEKQKPPVVLDEERFVVVGHWKTNGYQDEMSRPLTKEKAMDFCNHCNEYNRFAFVENFIVVEKKIKNINKS
jgi:hypothetical protein